MTYTLVMIVYLVIITITRMRLNVVGNICMKGMKLNMHISKGYFIPLLCHGIIHFELCDGNKISIKPKLIIQHEYG